MVADDTLEEFTALFKKGIIGVLYENKALLLHLKILFCSLAVE